MTEEVVTPVRMGISVVTLQVDPSKELIFDIMVPKSAELVAAWLRVAKSRGHVIGGQERVELIPVLSFLCPIEEQPVPRRLILLTAGRWKDDGAWEGPWIAEPGWKFHRTFVNPVDGSPVSVFEVPWEPEETPSQDFTDQIAVMAANLRADAPDSP